MKYKLTQDIPLMGEAGQLFATKNDGTLYYYGVLNGTVKIGVQLQPHELALMIKTGLFEEVDSEESNETKNIKERVRKFMNIISFHLTPANDTMNAVRLIRDKLPDFVRQCIRDRDMDDSKYRLGLKDGGKDMVQLIRSEMPEPEYSTPVNYGRNRAIQEMHTLLDKLDRSYE